MVPSGSRRLPICASSTSFQKSSINWPQQSLTERVIEAIEVVEAVEVIEAAEILRPENLLLGTSESSMFLNLALF